MKIKIFFIIFAVTTSFSSFSEIKIIGGEVAPVDTKSGILNIIIAGPGGESDWSQCTGSKVSKNAILTAAHCVYKYRDNALAVFFNNDIYNPDKNFEGLEIEKVIIHPSYKGTDVPILERLTQNDLAVLIVKETENFPEFSKLEKLQIEYAEIRPDQKLELWGYGCQAPIANTGSEVEVFTKKTAQANTLEKNILHNIGGNFPEVLSSNAEMIYATKFITVGRLKNQSAPSLCSGDSGGPVLLNKKIVGVNSTVVFNDLDVAGEIVSGISYINLHSRTSPIKDWLAKSLKH